MTPQGNGKWGTADLLTALLIALIAVAGMQLAIKICQVDAQTPHVEAVMCEAQERIDAYYASQPARERPVVVAETPAPVVESTAPEALDWYIESLPLDKQLQKAVFDASNENGVDYFTVLGLIQVESNFQVDAVSPVTGCRGLCQLSPVYFPGDYTPEGNVQAGTEYLGKLLATYHGDVQAALRAYNRGYDDGARGYPHAVLSAAEDIMRQAGVVFP